MKRLFHRHRWAVLDVNTGVNGLGGAITVLLRRCETCDEHRTETLNGHWPRKLFTPPTSTDQGE